MDDPEVIKAAFEESGLDAEKLMEQMQDPDVKAKLISNTEAAAERGFLEYQLFLWVMKCILVKIIYGRWRKS